MKTKNKSWYCDFEDEILKLSLIAEMEKKKLLKMNSLLYFCPQQNSIWRSNNFPWLLIKNHIINLMFPTA